MKNCCFKEKFLIHSYALVFREKKSLLSYKLSIKKKASFPFYESSKYIFTFYLHKIFIFVFKSFLQKDKKTNYKNGSYCPHCHYYKANDFLTFLQCEITVTSNMTM